MTKRVKKVEHKGMRCNEPGCPVCGESAKYVLAVLNSRTLLPEVNYKD